MCYALFKNIRIYNLKQQIICIAYTLFAISNFFQLSDSYLFTV